MLHPLLPCFATFSPPGSALFSAYSATRPFWPSTAALGSGRPFYPLLTTNSLWPQTVVFPWSYFPRPPSSPPLHLITGPDLAASPLLPTDGACPCSTLWPLAISLVVLSFPMPLSALSFLLSRECQLPPDVAAPPHASCTPAVAALLHANCTAL
ncbi:hypothetical protein GOP47_0010027 [Adiantum capillus-veneris]|uniref:Uncharacterized protein n=1 Tax=Adiantum capillus-veneris TaxID=13818 RepID=A0A9D4UXZ7_ADICA|nr:hypothetical protein GOP47_0010027 [Adiantum capillus-veneris]